MNRFLRDADSDPIGSRQTLSIDEGVPTAYTSNNLNQYTQVSPPAAPQGESFTYDEDGNLTADGSYVYVWNAENRLVSVRPLAPYDLGDKHVANVYDYLGRRVEKRVDYWDGSQWSVVADRLFVYDGWNLLLELNGMAGDAVEASYTWGLDLSGQAGDPSPGGLHGAGGVGGLLAIYDPTTSDGFVYFHDANGNVGQMLAANGVIAAHYEYDPYGGATVAVGALLSYNPFRFSTKYFDGEIDYPGNDADGLYYYGYRFYSPRLGRWLNRDPLFTDLAVPALPDFGESAPTPFTHEERSLYAFVRNAASNAVDPFGLKMRLVPDGDSALGPCGKYKYAWYVSFGPQGAPCDGYLVQEVHVQAQCIPCIPPQEGLISVIPDDLVYWEAIRVKKGDRRASTDTASWPGKPHTYGHNSQRGTIRLFCNSPDIGDLSQRWPAGQVGRLSRCVEKDGNAETWSSGSFPHTMTRPRWWGDFHAGAGQVDRLAWSYWDCCDCNNLSRAGAEPWWSIH